MRSRFRLTVFSNLTCVLCHCLCVCDDIHLWNTFKQVLFQIARYIGTMKVAVFFALLFVFALVVHESDGKHNTS